MLSRYAWTDSLPRSLRYATGVEGVREVFLPRTTISSLPGWLTETSRTEPRSLRQRAAKRLNGGIRKWRDLSLMTTKSIRDAAAIRAEEIDRLIFVCKGNICRSSFAEAVARSKGWPAESFGLDVEKPQSADEEANKVALMLGVDMTDHGSRSIHEAVFSKGDCLVAMEPEQLVALQGAKERYGCQVTLLGIWGASSALRVPDPFGKGRREMVRVFRQIEDSLSGLLRAIERSRL
jgi:protein-tyrosine phosphatase